MIEAGSLGRKTKAKGGFYRIQKEDDGSKTKLSDKEKKALASLIKNAKNKGR